MALTARNKKQGFKQFVKIFRVFAGNVGQRLGCGYAQKLTLAKTLKQFLFL